ncbi:hypothetical protein WUBG_11869 [Wuchereria bancrofti]|uniref:Uncharacterized protein n=1 Tax=Wuchereria bancrofti TaxID=6293 RepID=J9EPL1_WUCBA|nr:hypothetical protein WUBG_11869 [Wuchereria bancrofti]
MEVFCTRKIVLNSFPKSSSLKINDVFSNMLFETRNVLETTILNSEKTQKCRRKMGRGDRSVSKSSSVVIDDIGSDRLQDLFNTAKSHQKVEQKGERRRISD